MYGKKYFFITIVLLLLLSACRKQGQKASWDADFTTPLVNTTLDLTNLSKDSIIKVNPDNSLLIDYSNTLYEFNLADQFIHIPDTSIYQSYSINQINLGNIHINYKATLGSMADAMVASGNSSQVFIGNFIKNQHGQYANIPPVSGLQPSPFQFDASQFFTHLSVSSAKIEFWLVNKFPVDITNVQFELRNTNTNVLLFSDVIGLVRAKDSVYYSRYINNVELENNITFKVTNISSPGTNGVPQLIDTNDYVDLHGGISQIQVTDAIAKFPAQELVGSDGEITLDLGDRKFTYVDCRSGQLIVTIKSNIQEKVKLKYILKGAYDKFGRPLVKETQVPESTGGSQLSSISETFDLSGYSISLTGSDGAKFNTYTQVLSARIDSTGIERHISNLDSLYFEYKLINIKPNYIKGYAGVDTVSVNGDAAFDFLNIFANSQPNSLKFEDLDLRLTIENGIGLEGDVTIQNLSGTNANGNTVNLTTNTGGIIGTPQRVPAATDFPFTPAYKSIGVNSNNSNVNTFLSNLPNKIHYDMFLKTNPRGNLQTYDNFAYLESRMKVKLDVQLPLSLLANNLILTDSIDFSLGNTADEIENIKDGILYFHINNKFPIEANLSFVVYDENWQLLDTLMANELVKAADLNANCKADNEKKTILSMTLSEERKEKIKNARHAKIISVFNTRANASCNNQFVKIYSDYKLKVVVGARFNYKVKV